MAGSLRDFVQTNKDKSSSMTSLLSTASSGISSKWTKFTSHEPGSASQNETLDGADASDGWFSKAKEDPCLPSLSKKQRIIGFMGCLVLGLFCFGMSSLYIPVLVFKARKFALLYSMGSMFFILSFAALWGPVNHLKHLFSGDRLPFTIIYFCTIFATLYFSLWKRSYVFTIICAIIQILALVWYIVSYIPGGQTGLKFFSRIFYSFTTKTASAVLPL